MLENNVNSHIPRVCAVVPVYNRKEQTLRFIKNFNDVTYPNKDLIIVDDGSTDGTCEKINQLSPETTVLKGKGNLWWSSATNKGIKYALENGADYILTINNDVAMKPDFLTKMVEIAKSQEKAIVGCRILWQDSPEQIWAIGSSAIFSRGELYRLNYHNELWSKIEGTLDNPFPVDTMPGNGVLIPKRIFEDVGFYDEKWMPQYHADSDFVLRAAKKGYRPLISLESVLYNHRCLEPLANNKRELIFSKKSGFYWRVILCTLYRHSRKIRFIHEVFWVYKAGFKTLPQLEGSTNGFKRIKKIIKTLPLVGPLLVTIWRLAKNFKQTYKNVCEELAVLPCNAKQEQKEIKLPFNYAELSIDDIQRDLDKRYKNGTAYVSTTLWDDVRSKELHKQCIDMISPTDGKKILDLGCGIGGIVPYISACRKYIGIDLSKEAIKKASCKYGNKPGFSFIVMDAQNLNFSDCTFDLVIANEVIEHVPDIERTLEEAFRVLKPGGYILITSPNLTSLHLRVNRMLGYKDFKCSFDHIKEFTFEKAEKLLSETGFKVTNTAGVFLQPYWGIPGIDEHVRHLTDNEPEMVDILKELGSLCGAKYAFCYIIRAEKPNNGKFACL